MEKYNKNKDLHVHCYASAGAVLTHYVIDTASGRIKPQASFAMPSRVQYAWPHPTAAYLVAACSDGSPEIKGTSHCLVTVKIDAETHALRQIAGKVALPARAVHMTLDGDGTHALVAYARPSGLSVHRLHADGALGSEVVQQDVIDAGIYAHQVRVAPSNSAVVIVARGNNPKDGNPEDPGALKLHGYANGQLAFAQSVAPNGGYGFGPRHIDFHPTKPWLYASLERQNLLHMYRLNADATACDAQPAYVKPTLADVPGERRRQRSGTIHAHPNGRFVYVVNRASGVAPINGQDVYIGGENNIVVYAIDPTTGEPTAIQHEDTRGVVARTFALDASGQWLVTANSMPILMKEGANVATLPPSLAVFRVGGDGRLTYMSKFDVDTKSQPLFWMGVVS